MMAQLYDVDVRAINEHISHIFNDGELDQGATVRNFRIVQIEGSRNVSREVMHYITNEAHDDYAEDYVNDGDDVVKAADATADTMTALFTRIIERL